MADLVLAVIETRAAFGVSLVEAFDQVARQHGLDDLRADDLRNETIEFLRMIDRSDAA